MKNKSEIKPFPKVSRLGQLATILLKYGFEDVIARLELRKYLPRRVAAEKEAGKKEGTTFQRLRLAFEEMGPTFIKFGQLMSNRGDLFPKPLVEELEKLQESVPPFPADEAVAIIEKDLKKPLKELFSEFSEMPVASASIAQVHKARLLTGEEVAVKVKRPFIDHLIATDIAIMREFATVVQRYFPKIEQFHILDFIEEFEHAINKELNLKSEAENIGRFRYNMKKEKEVYAPKVYKKHLSEKVLVMEFINGVRILNIKGLIEKGHDMKRVAKICLESYFKQIIEHSLFHADPHPGNLLVMDDGRLCFIDFGIMGIVQRKDRDMISSFVIGLQTRDTHRVVRTLQKASPRSIPNIERLEYRLGELIEEYSYQALSDIDTAAVSKRLRDIVIKFRINIPSNLFLLIKTVSLVESIVRRLDPELNITGIVKPFGKKLILERVNPVNVMKNLFLSALDINTFIREIPADAEEVIKKIKEGTINIHLEHMGLEELIQTLDTVSSRISVAIILAAIIVASALIVLSKLPPTWNGIPVIGMIGFLISAVIGFLLLLSIFFGRKKF